MGGEEIDVGRQSVKEEKKRSEENVKKQRKKKKVGPMIGIILY